MNCKFINVLMFAAGATIGSAVTWKVLKTRYERIAQEEIDSVKEVFADRMGDTQDNVEEDCGDEDEDRRECDGQIDWDELEDLDEDDDESDTDDADPNDYARLVNSYTNQKGGAEIMEKEPYVISPYDFGELDDYSQIELTYYADEILEDDEYNIVTDVNELLGPHALTSFGEYEDDSVFVRNDRLRIDFQVLKDYRTYAEARSISPKRVGDE